jgi:hypothetical protein
VKKPAMKKTAPALIGTGIPHPLKIENDLNYT